MDVPVAYAMTVRERVAAFLMATPGLRLCDECLGHVLEIHPASAHRAAVKITGTPDFIREQQVCSRCGKSRLTTTGSH